MRYYFTWGYSIFSSTLFSSVSRSLFFVRPDCFYIVLKRCYAFSVSEAEDWKYVTLIWLEFFCQRGWIMIKCLSFGESMHRGKRVRKGYPLSSSNFQIFIIKYLDIVRVYFITANRIYSRRWKGTHSSLCYPRFSYSHDYWNGWTCWIQRGEVFIGFYIYNCWKKAID